MIKGLKPSTSQERRALFIETVLGITDLVSKVSPNSVMQGVGGGVSKIAGSAEKDIILAVSLLYPDYASGSQLDQVASNFGIGPRGGASGSSTYVRLSAAPGTVYLAGTNICLANNGIAFQLEADQTMNSFGFMYAKVNSTTQGSNTNVAPLSISKISPAPSGHLNIVNEVAAIGGADIESDELFRRRIKNAINILARGTEAMLEQVFISINPKVLQIFHDGVDLDGKVVISIVTQSGADLTNTELNQLMAAGNSFFTMTESRPYGQSYYGIRLKPMEFFPVDMSFRVDLDPGYDPDMIRKNIQIGINKYMDFRFFDPAFQKIEWDNLLQIVKNVKGVNYVPDQYFNPRTDMTCDSNKLPRLRGFLMLDMTGAIISDFSGALSPVYYPNNPDFGYQATVLQEI